MKKRNKALIATVLVAALAVLPVVVLAGKEQAESQYAENRPEFEEILQDTVYPEVLQADDNKDAEAKQWYEYITYSDTPAYATPLAVKTPSTEALRNIMASIGWKVPNYIPLYNNNNIRIAYYDPIDYTNAMVMEIGDTLSESYHSETFVLNQIDEIVSLLNGKSDSENKVTMGFSTANSITVKNTFVGTQFFKASEDTEVTNELTVGADFIETCGFATAKQSFNDKLTTSLKTNVTYSEEIQHTTEVTQSFNAVYFGENGNPLPWRIISYTVRLPIRCAVEIRDENGNWVQSGDSLYILYDTVAGTCRQWIDNGDAYYEHWATGEKVLAGGFWQSYFSAQSLMDAYVNSLMPTKVSSENVSSK